MIINKFPAHTEPSVSRCVARLCRLRTPFSSLSVLFLRRRLPIEVMRWMSQYQDEKELKKNLKNLETDRPSIKDKPRHITVEYEPSSALYVTGCYILIIRNESWIIQISALTQRRFFYHMSMWCLVVFSPYEVISIYIILQNTLSNYDVLMWRMGAHRLL